MLNAINTKILIAILGALGAISAYIIHERNEAHQAALNAAKTQAILLEQQQQRKAEADEHRHEDDQIRRTIEAERKKNNSNNRPTSKTWQTYVP